MTRRELPSTGSAGSCMAGSMERREQWDCAATPFRRVAINRQNTLLLFGSRPEFREKVPQRVGLCALRAHPSLRSGPSPLRGSVLRRAARASSNPGAFVHPRLAAIQSWQTRISGPDEPRSRRRNLRAHSGNPPGRNARQAAASGSLAATVDGSNTVLHRHAVAMKPK